MINNHLIKLDTSYAVEASNIRRIETFHQLPPTGTSVKIWGKPRMAIIILQHYVKADSSSGRNRRSRGGSLYSSYMYYRMTHETGFDSEFYAAQYHCRLKHVILPTFLYNEEKHAGMLMQTYNNQDPRDSKDGVLLLLLNLTHDAMVTCNILRISSHTQRKCQSHWKP